VCHTAGAARIAESAVSVAGSVREGKKLKTEPRFPLLHHLPTDWPQLHNWLARHPWSHLTKLHKSCVGGVGVHNFFKFFSTNKNGKKESPATHYPTSLLKAKSNSTISTFGNCFHSRKS
jgi:hypothetical protein